MKKISVALVLVVLMSLLVSSIAYAAPTDAEKLMQAPFGGIRFKFGEVIELVADKFTIETRDGGNYTYLVDENTRFRIKDVDGPTFASLEVGQWVIVMARSIEGDLVARVVGVTPEGFNPSKWFGVQARGEVLNVDVDAGTVAITKPSGEEIVYSVGDRTRFLGQASSLDELGVGWVIGVAGGELEDGTFMATIIAAAEQPRRVRHIGTINSLDEDSGTLSILTRNGEDKTFSIDEDTKFRSKENAIEKFSDLQLDMAAVVIAVLQEDGSYLIKHIGAADKADLPNYAVKAGGKVVEINTDTFTIETRDGAEITFTVSDETNFRGRGIDVQSLEDVVVGQNVLVGGDVVDDGSNLARLVIVIQKPAE